ncbi:MAG TPA: hypothetical protein VF170_09060 [Planctomycetaceae bacterium]
MSCRTGSNPGHPPDGRVAELLETLSREPSEGRRATVFIALFVLTSLGAQIVFLRITQVFGSMSTVMSAALVWPALATAAVAVGLAFWSRRSLRWWWLAFAAVPWLTIAGGVTLTVLDCFV